MNRREEEYGVSQNEIITKFSFNRNLERLIENDIKLKDRIIKDIADNEFPIKEYSSIYHYVPGELVLYKTGKEQINIYLLECINEDEDLEKPTPPPSTCNVNGRKIVVPDEYWKIYGRDAKQNDEPISESISGVLDDSKYNLDDIAISYVDNATIDFQKNHVKNDTYHPFGFFSKKKSNVLFSSLENIDDNRKKFLYPYLLQSLDEDNVIQHGYMRKWPNGVVEYDINFKLGSYGYNSYGYEKVKANNVQITDRYANRLYFKNEYTQDNVFDKSGDQNVIINGTVQENLVNGVNVFAGEIYFPQPFKDTNYMVFAGNAKNVDSGLSSYIYRPLITFADKRLYIDGKTVTGYVPPGEVSYGITPLKLPNEIVNLADNCFEQFVQSENEVITNIDIDPLKSELVCIGDQAFKDSTIKSIVIPASTKYIGTSAFYHCANLDTITIYLSGDTSDQLRIGKNAFLEIGKSYEELNITINFVSVVTESNMQMRASFSDSHFIEIDSEISSYKAALSNNSIPLYRSLTDPQICTSVRKLYGLPENNNNLYIGELSILYLNERFEAKNEAKFQAFSAPSPSFFNIKEEQNEQELNIDEKNDSDNENLKFDIDLFKRIFENTIVDKAEIQKIEKAKSKEKTKFGYFLTEQQNAVISSILSTSAKNIVIPSCFYEKLEDGNYAKYDVAGISSFNTNVPDKIRKIDCSKKYKFINFDWLQKLSNLTYAKICTEFFDESILSGAKFDETRIDIDADYIGIHSINNVEANSLTINISIDNDINDIFENISCKNVFEVNVTAKNPVEIIHIASDEKTQSSITDFSCSNISSISQYAFENLTNLDFVKINMENCFINDFAFSNCPDLDEINLVNAEKARTQQDFVPQYSSNGNFLSVEEMQQKGFSVYAFNGTNVSSLNIISSENVSMPVMMSMFSATLANIDEDVVIPFASRYENSGLTVEINDGALTGLSTSSPVVNLMPYELTSINENAFNQGYEEIKSIYLNSKIKTIKDNAFIKLSNLNLLNIAKTASLNSIGVNALANTDLEKFELRRTSYTNEFVEVLDYSVDGIDVTGIQCRDNAIVGANAEIIFNASYKSYISTIVATDDVFYDSGSISSVSSTISTIQSNNIEDFGSYNNQIVQLSDIENSLNANYDTLSVVTNVSTFISSIHSNVITSEYVPGNLEAIDEAQYDEEAIHLSIIDEKMDVSILKESNYILCNITTIEQNAVSGNNLFNIDLDDIEYVKECAFISCSPDLIVTIHPKIKEIHTNSFLSNDQDSFNFSIVFDVEPSCYMQWNENEALTTTFGGLTYVSGDSYVTDNGYSVTIYSNDDVEDEVQQIAE